MTNKVSVIIPAYNVESCIFRAFESALGQSYKNIEVVVVDDGSTDATWEVIQRYATQDSRVVAVSKENGGVSSARNRALELASGDYVVFLDSDDWLEPDAIEYLLNLQSKYPGCLVSACGRTVNSAEEAGNTLWDGAQETVQRVSAEEAMCNVGTHKYSLTSACYKLFELAAIQRGALSFDTDIHYCEDGLFVLRCLRGYTSFVISNRILWNILSRPGSATSSAYNPRLLTAITAAERMLDCIPDSESVYRATLKNVLSKTELIENWALGEDTVSKQDVAFMRSKLKSYGPALKKSHLGARAVLKYCYYTFLPVSLLRLLVRLRKGVLRRMGKL